VEKVGFERRLKKEVMDGSRDDDDDDDNDFDDELEWLEWGEREGDWLPVV